MPVSKDFNDSDQEWHYALSWMACDYIAATYGESRIWELMDAMHNGGEGTSDATRTACSSRSSATTATSSPAGRPPGSATSTAERPAPGPSRVEVLQRLAP